ncbi:hypothetical protein [Streptomyces aureus]|uniref:hypothetical protein n=1 Tax=Streptomyces aureus TaxID=193461 RepID=UPI0036BFD34B
MKREPKWHNDPRWELLMVIAPLLLFVTIADDVITRFLTAAALASSAIRYGRGTAKRASLKTGSNTEPS